MATSQKVQIDTYDFGESLTAPTLENPLTGDTITDGTAATCNEQSADSGVYIADYVGADASHLVPAGTYRLTTAVNGQPLKRWVTFTGVDGEVVFARAERTAALDPATQTQVTNIENASGYMLAVLAGACADPQTASESYAITVFGSTFTVDMAGQTSAGVRTAPTLTKT